MGIESIFFSDFLWIEYLLPYMEGTSVQYEKVGSVICTHTSPADIDDDNSFILIYSYMQEYRLFRT